MLGCLQRQPERALPAGGSGAGAAGARRASLALQPPTLAPTAPAGRAPRPARGGGAGPGAGDLAARPADTTGPASPRRPRPAPSLRPWCRSCPAALLGRKWPMREIPVCLEAVGKIPTPKRGASRCRPPRLQLERGRRLLAPGRRPLPAEPERDGGGHPRRGQRGPGRCRLPPRPTGARPDRHRPGRLLRPDRARLQPGAGLRWGNRELNAPEISSCRCTMAARRRARWWGPGAAA